MGNFEFIKLDIEGLYLVSPIIYKTDYGFFFENYNQKEFFEAGLKLKFVQDNESRSKKNVLRGLHVQKHYPQGKYVRVAHGEIFDVAVDMRKNSKTYLQWHGEILSDENRNALYIPEGFAHGFFVLSEYADVIFKVSDVWHPNDEIGIPWNDKSIGIKWPNSDESQLIIAEKDSHYTPVLDNTEL